MKTLALSDRAPRTPIAEILKREQVDLIVTLGDFDLQDIRALENVTDIPKIGVYGNHCSGNYMEQLGIRNMHLTTWEFGGIIFGGFEGSHKYKDSDAKMYTQEEADTLLKDFPHVDVFLAHSPPYGINDEPDDVAHQGFKALRKYLDEQHPRYFLHGHTYPTEEMLVKRYGDTEIVYVFADRIIEVA